MLRCPSIMPKDLAIIASPAKKLDCQGKVPAYNQRIVDCAYIPFSGDPDAGGRDNHFLKGPQGAKPRLQRKSAIEQIPYFCRRPVINIEVLVDPRNIHFRKVYQKRVSSLSETSPRYKGRLCTPF